MRKEQLSIESMKTNFMETTDPEEASRWANQIGHAYKDKGGYIQSLNWFKKDMEIVSQRIASGQASTAELMATCQCMGETFLRLHNYDNALDYQERHYNYAKEAGDAVEQQRAATQLGRTYMDVYEEARAENDPEKRDEAKAYDALQKCRKFLRISMDLARELKRNPPKRDSPSFVRELADAYNNLGLLRSVTQDYQRAEDLLLKALNICDEEEMREDDEVRSRIHHNLGQVYYETRQWSKAKENMQRDINICSSIGERQGEAKGLINLGRLALKQRQFDDATQSFKRALAIGRRLTDEDTLVETAKFNLEVVKKAETICAELEADERRLKAMQRSLGGRRDFQRSYLKTESELLRKILEASEDLGDWERYLFYSKRQKKVMNLLGDADKLAEAYGAVAVGYLNLRSFEKAKKWTMKSIETCKRTKNFQGQAIARIEHGDILDANGDYLSAQQAYQDAFEVASSQGNELLEEQISALEKIQYICVVRLEDANGAREANCRVEDLKQRLAKRSEVKCSQQYCSDSDCEEANNDRRIPSAREHENTRVGICAEDTSTKSRKKQRVILDEDDEDDPVAATNPDPVDAAVEISSQSLTADSASFHAGTRPRKSTSFQHMAASHSNSRQNGFTADDIDHGPIEVDGPLIVPVSIGGSTIRMELKQAEPVTFSGFLEKLTEQYKYTKPEGPHPVLTGLMVMGEDITTDGNIYDKLVKHRMNVEVIVAGWREVPFVELYKLQCLRCKSNPIPELVKKLDVAKEGEIDGRDCELDKITAWPLLLAIGGSNDIISSINLAHNSLESSMMNELQRKLGSSKGDIGLALDFHDNKLGANALLEMCNYQSTLCRLEVLILSKNQLSDRIARNICSVVENAPRLQILELDECGLTTPTFEGLSETLKPESRLRRLAIGNNHPIAGHALKRLLIKLSTLSSFTDLEMSDVQANCSSVEGLLHLIRMSNTFSVLVVKQNPVGAESWLQLSNTIKERPSQFVRMDLADCKIASDIGHHLYGQLLASPTLVDLSLAGNTLDERAVNLLAKELGQSSCQLKKLNLSDCSLSSSGMLKILDSLQANDILVDIRLACNIIHSCARETSNDMVADSEDDEGNVDAIVQRLVSALSAATSLLNVDLSENGLEAAVDQLYKGWSHRRRRPKKHVDDQGRVLHFTVDGFACCSSRSCCV